MKPLFSILYISVFLFAGLGGTGSAAVAYTDFQDLTTHSSKYFDLDGNGSFDLGVAWEYNDWDDDTVAAASLPFNAPLGNGFAASGALALKLGSGDAIGSALDFRSDTVMLSRYMDWDTWDYTNWGNWDNMAQGDTGFLGFRFLDGSGELHYGWLRAHVDPDNQYITLYDLAWETSVGTTILAGDKGAAVPLPGAVWLLGAGLVGLAGLNKKTADTMMPQFVKRRFA